MDRRIKRRVARVGQCISNEHKIVDDVVSSIMQQMNDSIPNSGVLKSTLCEGNSGRSYLDVPSAIPTQQVTTVQQKKILTTTRYPLMEKAQKSKNYIRHNRSMPKPRAHLGGLNDPSVKKIVSHKRQDKSFSIQPERAKPNSNAAKVLHSKPNDIDLSDDYNSDVSSKYNVPVESTDSDSDFEDFIQAQKRDAGGGEGSSKKRKKMKHSKDYKNSKKKNCIKNKEPRSKRLSNDDDLVKSSKIHSKPTATNRRKLPETSDSSSISSDEESSNRMHRKEELTKCSENRNVREMDACEVLIERNPLLDETATKLNRLTEDDDNLCATVFQGCEDISMVEHRNETALISDDDCLIVCEVPTSKVTDESHVTDNDTESSIQISDVVSLGECQEVTKINNGNLPTIDFKKLKEVIEATNKQNSCHQEEILSSLNKSNPEFVLNTSLDSMRAITDVGLNERPCSPLSTDDREIVNTTVLKEILSIANNGNINPHDAMYMESVKYEDPTELTAPFMPADVIETIDKKDLEKILLGVKSESNETLPDSSSCSSAFTDKLPLSSSFIAENLNTSALKDIISTANQFSNPSKGNSFNDSDELDIFGVASTRDLSRNTSSQNILQLLKIRNKILKEYDEIKDSERSLIGLQNLQSSLAARTKQIATVIEHIIENDPCFRSTLKNNLGTVVNYNVEDAHSTTPKKCDCCGAAAAIFCDKCHKAYYCSIQCGENDWSNGHYRNCQGIP